MDLEHVAILIAIAIAGFLAARAWEHRASMPGTSGGAIGAVFIALGVAHAAAPPMDILWYLYVAATLAAGVILGNLTIPDRNDPVIVGEDLPSIQAASSMRDKARREVEDFGQGRNGWALHRRFVDSFVVSSDEMVRDGALRRIEIAEEHLTRCVPNWTHARAEALLAADAQASAKADAAHEAHLPHRRRIDAAARLLEFARTAARDLSQAVADLESARSMEVMDAVSSNKGISAMSHASTSNASSSVSQAQESVRLLAAEAGVLSHHLPRVGDTMDFVFDMAMDTSFDFMSWLNIGQLSSAIYQCREALSLVEAEVERLDALHRQAKADGDPTLGKWYEATWRYMDAARAELPTDAQGIVSSVMPLRPY